MSLFTFPVVSSRRRFRLAGLAAAAALWATITAAQGVLPITTAQAAPPVDANAPAAQPTQPKTLPIEKQAPQNPFPRGSGDSQNRSRAASDIYWGIADDNVPWYLAPISRTPNPSGDVLGLGQGAPVMTLDGWQYPRLGVVNGVLLNGAVNSYALTQGAQGGLVGTVTVPTPWLQVPVDNTGNTSTNANSSNAAGQAYYRAPAVPRPTAPANAYPGAYKFGWAFQNAPALIPGAANIQRRYSIVVHIPEPATNQDPESATREDRIDDARYTVYYYILRTGGNPAVATDYIAKQQTFLLSQTGGGDTTLKDENGTTLYFPFFTSATFAATGFGATLPAQTDASGNPVNPPFYATNTTALKQGVGLDNTTDNTGDSFQFVIADSLSLEPGTDLAPATPTVTPAHGGTKLGEFDAAERAALIGNTAFVPPLDATKKNQRRSFLPSLTGDDSTTFNANAALRAVPPIGYDIATIATDVLGTNGTQKGYYTTGADLPNFINDPLDPLYDRNNANFNPNGFAAPSYTLETWNPTTVFEGPESLIDPRLQYNPGFAGTDPNNIAYLLNQVALTNEASHPYGQEVGAGIPNRPRVEQTDPNGERITDPIQAGQTRPVRFGDANNHQRYGTSRQVTGGSGTGAVYNIVRSNTTTTRAAVRTAKRHVAGFICETVFAYAGDRSACSLRSRPGNRGRGRRPHRHENRSARRNLCLRLADRRTGMAFPRPNLSAAGNPKPGRHGCHGFLHRPDHGTDYGSEQRHQSCRFAKCPHWYDDRRWYCRFGRPGNEVPGVGSAGDCVRRL